MISSFVIQKTKGLVITNKKTIIKTEELNTCTLPANFAHKLGRFHQLHKLDIY